mgnify:CR=1 FL=1
MDLVKGHRTGRLALMVEICLDLLEGRVKGHQMGRLALVVEICLDLLEGHFGMDLLEGRLWKDLLVDRLWMGSLVDLLKALLAHHHLRLRRVLRNADIHYRSL